ncbi:MAG: filamentous hemagglutinin N-terminal domain-containing protein, partial [Alphaproteobacteria bacterium]|nr:filamentous hemagglutinin N-terminal domain-containing protein [Alphaproteobacteria bacterium]
MSQKNSAPVAITRILNTKVLAKRLMATSAMTLAGIVAMASSAYALDATALPTGGTFTSGTGGISTTGNTMNVTTNQTRTVMDWDSFNIGSAATVNVNQFNSSSTTVNRVNSAAGDPTQIYGNLKSNGKIVILDPNGVFFGASAKVDVGSLLASTGTMDAASMAEFVAGRAFILSNLDAVAGAKIENLSNNISVKNSGLLAFVAPTVQNAGTLTAQLGKVVLASGKTVTVDLSGDGLITLAADQLDTSLVENSGTIKANGGTVIMTAGAAKNVVDSVVNMSGVVQANFVSNKNGKIVLGSSSTGKVNVTGTLEAKRDQNFSTGSAGTVEISANDVNIASSAIIDVRRSGTLASGNGGSISINALNRLTLAGDLKFGGAGLGNAGSLSLQASILDILRNINMGTGALSIAANTI